MQHGEVTTTHRIIERGQLNYFSLLSYNLITMDLMKDNKTMNNWGAAWKNRICSTTMKVRKSLIKPVTRQKTCNYIELFGSSARDRHARRI